MKTITLLISLIIVCLIVGQISVIAAADTTTTTTTPNNNIPNPEVTVHFCEGTRCNTNCRRQTLTANQCYHDLSTGKHISFHVVTNTSKLKCWQGYGYNNSACKRTEEISRNSLACGSCANGHTRWDCQNVTDAILELTGCHNCQNCTNATRIPVMKCVRQPFPYNDSFGEVSQFGACTGGHVVVKTTYSSWFGCSGSSYQIGYPTRFCAGSFLVNDTSSRMWTVNMNPSVSTTTTTTTTAITSFGHPTIRLEGDIEKAF